jgi:hypothetical protein
LIGLSLSLCVADILAGKVKESEVALIVSGTKAETYDSVLNVVDGYAGTYWRSNEREGWRIAFRLWGAGKIVQPRIWGVSPHSIAAGHWIDVAADLGASDDATMVYGLGDYSEYFGGPRFDIYVHEHDELDEYVWDLLRDQGVVDSGRALTPEEAYVRAIFAIPGNTP